MNQKIKRVEDTYYGDLRDFHSPAAAPAFKFRLRKLCLGKEPILILWGKTACGKTLLARSLAAEMEKHGKTVLRLPGSALIQQIVESARSGLDSSESGMEVLLPCSILIVDGMEELRGKNATQQAAAELFCKLCRRGTKVILLSSPGNFYVPLLASLKGSGLHPCELTIPQLTRLDRWLYTRNKCRALGLQLPLAGTWKISKPANMGSVIGMINTAAAFSGTSIVGYRKKLTGEDLKLLFRPRY
ncbi:MAG: AAA family ATPase [Oscillospiraceae bacterium]|nr:AAA family ATPase [Oscillospiraceae bacterium]